MAKKNKIGVKLSAMLVFLLAVGMLALAFVAIQFNTGRLTQAQTASDSPLPCRGLFEKMTSKEERMAIFNALFEPEKVRGYGELCNANIPGSPYNSTKRYLQLLDPGKPFHPLYNPLVYKCGCS